MGHRVLQVFMFVGLCTLLAVPVQAASYYTVSDGTSTYAVTPITGTDAATYFSYSSFSGHPAFGTEADTGFIWLYEDTDDELVYLGLIFHTSASGSGSVDLALSGANAYSTGDPWVLKDDAANLDGYSSNTASWGWSGKTDGGVYGSWSDLSELILGLSNISGIDNWYWVDGDSDKLQFSGLTGTTSGTVTINTSSVPAPAALLLMASGLAGLAGVRRRLG